MMKCPLPSGAHVWAYSRDSGGDEQDIGAQNRAIERYCQDNGLLLARLFCDEARPGSNAAGREQFQEMMRLARSLASEALPVGLVLWSFSRFARDFDDAQFYKADIRRRGIAIVSIADDIPTDGRHGRLIEAVMDWHNDLFLEDLRQSVKRGLHDVARQGYAPGGFPPAGYKAERIVIGTKRSGEPRSVARWVPDPETAQRVRLAWEMRARGASYSEIHQATHVFGATNSYAAMFRNRTYLGFRKCGDLEIPGAHEPLITQELWDAVQRTLHERPERGAPWPEGVPHPRQKHSPFLLSGIARCLYCGAAMAGSHANAGRRPHVWPYYVCGHKKRHGWSSCQGRMIAARRVEGSVLQAVLDRVLTPTFIEELVEEVNTCLSVDSVDLDLRIEQTHKQLTEAERSIQSLLDLAETFGSKAAADRLLEREAERGCLQRELHSLEANHAQSRIEVSPEIVLAVIADMRDGLTGGDVEARRTLLRRFVDKVEIGNEGGRLWYTFPLVDVDSARLCLVPPRGFEPLSQA